MNGGSQQINGREGETATFLSRRFVTLSLCVVGFAPRHLNRSPASRYDERLVKLTNG